MKKLSFYASLVCVSLMWSCSKEYAVPEDETPEWLGGSIYEELQNPKSLVGTFKYYTRLADDLGYAEVLSRTGSKTIFPANDEAFEAFFASNNSFGVHSYDELTTSMKKALLYGSMLDNAILIGNLSNVSTGGSSYTQGMAIKHVTNANVMDSISAVQLSQMPAYNPYYNYYKTHGGLLAMYDNTVAPMVHFTKEFMLANDMTYDASPTSDFSIITGTTYEDGAAFVFDKAVMKQNGSDIYGNVTCQNGYIHQLNGVLVPPGNIAQMLRKEADTQYFSRMLDYFSAPFYASQETENYRTSMREQGIYSGDSIFAVRYFSAWSQGARNVKFDKEKNNHEDYLDWDPGWNGYYPKGASSPLNDIGALIVPDDDAVYNFFTTTGKYIFDDYGSHRTGSVDFSRERMGENLDSLFMNRPSIVKDILANLMKANFTSTFPSKFNTVLDDASEFMNENGDLALTNLKQKSDGRYDVLVGNNAVAYKMKNFISPAKYRSVLGISAVKRDYSVMKNFLEDKTEGGAASKYGADMYFYLISMKSWYNLLLPRDSKQDNFTKDFIYLDPSSVGHIDGPYCLRFYYDEEGVLQCDRYVNNGGTMAIDPVKGATKAASGEFNTAIQDMLNYGTIVLDNGDYLGKNGQNYYQTKSGGTVYFNPATNSVYGGVQKDPMVKGGSVFIQPSRVIEINDEENGKVYCLDRPVQPTVLSAIDMLKRYSDSFGKFYTFLEGFGNHDEDLVTAGISDTPSPVSGVSEVEKFHMIDLGEKVLSENGNISFLNAYNYTLFAPTDAAMDIAYANGLPTWADFEATVNSDPDKAKQMVETMRAFIYYHFINGTVYADDNVAAGNYSTFYSDSKSVIQKLKVSGGSGTLNVQEIYNVEDGSGNVTTQLGPNHSVDESSSTANIMSRDIYLDDTRKQARKMDSSSFITIHGISTPLCFNNTGQY
jgi:uncharacterized surface protein with fasciclin (FAS1) repeats